MVLPTIPGGALTLAVGKMLGVGGDVPNSQSIDLLEWPVGMKDLVNSKDRISGLLDGVEDMFFYAGTQQDFSDFLKDYAEMPDLEKHRLILHRGRGGVGTQAGGSWRQCDWKMVGRPGAIPVNGRSDKASGHPGYALEIHFWTEGRLSLDQVVIPESIEIVNANLVVG